MIVSRFIFFLLAGTSFVLAEAPQAEVHARRGYNLAREGRLADAENEMRQAIELAPENPLYHSGIAGLLFKDGKLADAKVEFEKALDLHPPENVRPLLRDRLKNIDLNLGAQTAQSGQFRQGMAVASSAVARFPADARVFQMLGYFQAKLQLNVDAVRSYSHSLQLDSSSPEASVGLGMAQFSAGMEDQAVRTLEAGVTRFPKDAMHYQALGVVLLRLSETGRATKDRARVLFQKAIEIDPALPEAHYELGTMALAANDVVAAKDHLLIAERSSPADSRVHFALARLYRMQGDTKNADREMQSFFAAKSAEQPGRVAALGKGEQ